jgi:hypothetical protein
MQPSELGLVHVDVKKPLTILGSAPPFIQVDLLSSIQAYLALGFMLSSETFLRTTLPQYKAQHGSFTPPRQSIFCPQGMKAACFSPRSLSLFLTEAFRATVEFVLQLNLASVTRVDTAERPLSHLIIWPENAISTVDLVETFISPNRPGGRFVLQFAIENLVATEQHCSYPASYLLLRQQDSVFYAVRDGMPAALESLAEIRGDSFRYGCYKYVADSD